MPKNLVAIKVLAHQGVCLKNQNRHENEIKTAFMHSLYQTRILYQIKCLLIGWNFIRYEVNFIATKKFRKRGGEIAS